MSAAACDELRKRGLDPSRPGYTLFETTVMAGESVTVRAHADKATTKVCERDFDRRIDFVLV